MAPSAIEHEVVVPPSKTEVPHREPQKLSGALDKYESFEVTPIIGTEFKNVDLTEWINAPNADELLRDLAITSKSRKQDRASKRGSKIGDAFHSSAIFQSLAVASFSSALKIISPTTCRSN